MIYVLDTDHLSLLQRASGEDAHRLSLRLEQVEARDQAVTVISFEEQTRGWMAQIARAKSIALQIAAYQRLELLLRDYSQHTLLSFDEGAAKRLAELQAQRIRIGTMDLKIAAIALAHDATLLSRNLRDFERVPGLRVEDWSA